MTSIIRPTTIADEKELIHFLARVFSVGHDAPFINPALLRWKYWDPREDYSGPRSLVIEKNGRIAAHAGLWPVTVGTEPDVRRGVHMIDWAADPAVPGAGISLLDRVKDTHDFVFCVGGTPATASVLPKVGFRTVAEALTWARPLRPWQQMLHHPAKDFRLPLRLARNFWWSRIPPRGADGGWAAVEPSPNSTPDPGPLAPERDHPFLRYLQQCPMARVLNFDILREGQKQGFFSLAVVGHQARLAGAWLQNPDSDSWGAAFRLAQQAALNQTGVFELIARSSATQACTSAATRAGMRVRVRTPVLFFDKGTDPKPVPLQFHLADNEDVFFQDASPSFLT